ncbi:rho GTPase-activating protein 35 isoform X2 [Aplysia californica]|uniref:Rho GTPase-activating protein 35 isoform X2 n=1 Tax=Aplysia californica TaxID=6500 RepID=A0ABM0JNH2_APLCA|nr:rho GTPase-activating protein 35 isoform X2 [Aplysia californica]
MARRAEGRTFNVSVIGLSGTERDKGQYGVGKSCLCNRFFNQVADNYYQEHISVLSQSDFAGRVINNDHFLYWGSVTKTDEGNNFTFHVIEQTEFIDDVSFSPFKTARTETYLKRAVGGKVQSAEKLMYICKDQLGMETDSAYPQVLMPEGKLTIDGFLCCFDVSKVPQRSIEKQVEFVASLLNNALKTKKPVILATTKGDSSCQEYVREAEKLTNRKEFKGNVPLVETSAHENINIEAAFLLLAHLMDKTKARTKLLPFLDARKQRHEFLAVAKDAYLSLLRSTVRDPKAVWNTWKKKLEVESDFGHYVEMFGTEQARKEFRAHTKRLRDEQIRSKEQRYLEKLPVLLKTFLPSLESIPERSWNTLRRLICEHEEFESNFVVVEEDGVTSWKQVESFLDNTEETRIPFDLLNSAEAEMCFRNHLNELQALHRKRELQLQFKKVLEENPQVTPGKPLSETYVFFLGKECFSSLDEMERSQVYEQHLGELRAAARAQFQELLWEKSHVFMVWNTAERLTQKDLQSITAALQDDPRYKALHRLEEDRKVTILNHLGFIQSPSRGRCSFGSFCIDTQVENLLGERAIRPELKSSSDSVDSGSKTLNLVLLGKDGLAIALNREIRTLCTDDEYRLESTTYSLDYRPIDGDVSREQNALATANFKPHGCLCVYNSEETLNYVKDSLERSLTNDVVKEGEATLSGMPIAIIQASNSSQSEKENERLSEKGRSIAARYHGEFIVDSEEVEEGVLFVEEQIHSALQMVIRGCSPGLSSWYLSDQFEPDIRLSMCLMCGDPFPLELPLGPLLNHDMCRVLADTPYCITLDLFLELAKQKVEVEVASYHGGNRLHQGLFHGHILVYSAKRKASLATLRAYSETLLGVPKLILAVADSGGASSSFFSSEVCQELIQEGNQLADTLGAAFMTTTANFPQQTAVFLPFFTSVWLQREDSELLFHEPSEEPCPPAYDEKAYYASRPPAPLPKQYAYHHTHKSSTSNSTDSEPVYDQPNLFHSRYSDSDHEADRGSSVSPPPGANEEIYSEVIIPNGEHLVKPSVVKARKNVYAGTSKWEHRKSLPIMPSAVSMSLDAGSMMGSTSSSGNNTMGATTTSSSGSGSFCNNSLPLAELSQPVRGRAMKDPQEFFRKSCSMKIAAEEAVEAGDEAEEEEEEEEDEESKENRLKGARGWLDISSASGKGEAFGPSRYGTSQSSHDIHWSQNDAESVSRRKAMSSRSQSQSAAMFRSHPGQVTAPLAKPEPIEIADYCHVKDAVPLLPLGDHDYQIVEDALPPGQLHRIRSTKSPIRVKGRTDSEDSEFSSLEREQMQKSRRSTPHRRKSKPRHQDNSAIYASPMPSSGKHRYFAFGAKENKGRSHSPSEGSDGTGDELLAMKKKGKKRRSFNHRKWRTPLSAQGHRASSPSMLSDEVQLLSSSQVHSLEDMSYYNPVVHHFQTLPKNVGTSSGAGEEAEFDPNDSNNWSNRFLFKTMKDPEKQRKKDERRKQKEEEKRAKEAQKRTKKKESKSSVTSTSGLPLEDYPTSQENRSIPHFVYKCVSYIEAEGLKTEGLYRIPGNKAQGELFLSQYAADPNVDISTLEIPVNAIATLLKSFFSDLSEALIPSALCDELLEAAEMTDKSSRLLMLRGVIKKLPNQNVEVLKFVISHLYKVSEHQEYNSMNSGNLAKCWWPTLIRLQFKTYEKMVQYSQVPEDIVQTLIEQCYFFFYGGNEV